MTSPLQGHPRDSIDLRDDADIVVWCRKLQCSEEELRRAIAEVGEAPLLVAEHLGLTEAALS
ncbi:MAG: DUF3606 domain-containing protein [Pseudomonadota bacterium]|nr:DUF3606 domain-containing protein [Pseudomonadota bacterium]